MIIGASLGSFKGLTLDGAMDFYLKLLLDFEIKAVELRFEKEDSRPSMWSWEENDKLPEFLNKFEVTGAHLPFTYLNPISPNLGIKKESLNQLKMVLDKASQLNMNYAVMHTRGSAAGLTYIQQLVEWEKVLHELADYSQSHSILLTIENGDFLGNLKELTGMVRRINSKWLKVTLDLGHAHIRRIKQTEQTDHPFPYPLGGLVLKALDRTFVPFLFKKYMPYEDYGSIKSFIQSENDLIFNLHVHDNNGGKDHIALGSGKIDFSLLSLLSDANIPLVLEVEFKDHYDNFRQNYNKLRDLIGER